MNLAQRLLIVLLLWVPFSLACLVAVPVSLFAVLVNEAVYARLVLRSMDRLMAAVIGYTGDYTVSAECGRSSCKACAIVCWILDRFDPGHCSRAARSEIR